MRLAETSHEPKGDSPVGDAIRFNNTNSPSRRPPRAYLTMISRSCATSRWGSRSSPSVPASAASAWEAGTLGDEREPQRDVAHDLEIMVRYARGGRLEGEFVLLKRIASPTGL